MKNIGNTLIRTSYRRRNAGSIFIYDRISIPRTQRTKILILGLGVSTVFLNPTNPTNSTNPINSMNSTNQDLDSRLMTILVTGGAGFIGSHLCERLLGLSPRTSDRGRWPSDFSDAGSRTSDVGVSVICLDNFNDFYDHKLKERNIAKLKRHPNFHLIRGDILDTDLLEKIFTGRISREAVGSSLSTQNSRSSFEPNDPHELNELDKPDLIVHLAALAGVRPSIASPAEYVDVDIKGTVNLLDMARRYKIKQFIFASSSSVYGANQKIPFSEDDPIVHQVSPYATAKAAGELYCKTYQHLYGIPTTVLRFFTVYGPRQRPDMAIRKFTELLSQGKPIPMFGDGTSERDYTYIDDCINGVMAAIEKPFEFETFNLGNSTMVKLKDLLEIIAEKLGIEPEIDQQPNQPGDVPVTYADTSKARELLGYNPKTSIEEGIESFIQWFVEQAA